MALNPYQIVGVIGENYWSVLNVTCVNRRSSYIQRVWDDPYVCVVLSLNIL